MWIFASYVKSSDNFHADKESRKLSDDTEWEISKIAFKKINKKFGKFDIDLFATKINKKCVKFVSWFPDPEAIAIDAFTISWTKLYFYTFPPFSLILPTLQKIRNDGARGVLIVPLWDFHRTTGIKINLFSTE